LALGLGWGCCWSSAAEFLACLLSSFFCIFFLKFSREVCRVKSHSWRSYLGGRGGGRGGDENRRGEEERTCEKMIRWFLITFISLTADFSTPRHQYLANKSASAIPTMSGSSL
jgi:hypothetical protein